MNRADDAKTCSQARFGQFAAGYVASETHARGRDLERLIEIAQPQPDWLVLDVATGGGHTALKLAPSVAAVVATDLTPRMLDQAEAFIKAQGVENVTFRLADAEDLPFEDETFDLVTCRIAAHHFPDPARFVGEGVRVLKPGGMLLVQDQLMPGASSDARYVNDYERLRDPSHNRAWSEAEWIQIFQGAGLYVTHREEILKRQRFLTWAALQDCTPETIELLKVLVAQAPPGAAAWMQARDFGTEDASFAIHHIIIAGRKAGGA